MELLRGEAAGAWAIQMIYDTGNYSTVQPYARSDSLTAAPISAGLFTTRTPAAVERRHLLGRRALAARDDRARRGPSGAPAAPSGPAMNPTTGFLKVALMYAAASSSAFPPISPIITTASVAGSAANSVSASMKRVPISGSPPMPMQVVWPRPSLRQLVDRLVGQRAALRHDPDPPFLADVPRDDAGLGLAGGDEARAVRADEPRLRCRARPSSARIMSSVGMPSVMQTASGSPASAASRMASAAHGGGTKITDAFAPVSRTASATVLNTGQPSCVVPALAGRHAADDLRAVRRRLLRVKGAFAAGDALDDEARVVILIDAEYRPCESVALRPEPQRDDLARPLRPSCRRS